MILRAPSKEPDNYFRKGKKLFKKIKFHVNMPARKENATKSERKEEKKEEEEEEATTLITAGSELVLRNRLLMSKVPSSHLIIISDVRI